MATLTGKLVADTYKALLKMIDNDVVTATEKQISDGLGGGTGIFIDQDGEIRASKYRVTAGTSSQFLKADGSLDSTSYLTKAIADGFYLQIGTTTTSIPEGSNLYFTNSRVLNTTLNGFTAVSGTVTSADSVLTAIEKIWWNIVNGGGGGGGGYVPYVGATQNLNLGEYGLLGGFVQFDTTPTTAPNAVGALSWNDQDGTLDLKLKGGNVTLQIGQEQVTRVVNKTGINLLESNYQAVRISGAQGNRLKVALAQANNDANSAETLGLVTENINDNNEGFITSSGLVRDINTTGSLQGETWADGDILYLSGTTAGRLTNIKPQAPIHTVIIGFVVRAHATQGAIYVKVDNGYELDELHNVKITAPEDKDFLVYDGTNLYWENRSIYGTEGYLPIYNDTNIFKDSIIYSDGVGIGVGTNILEPTAIATFFGNVDLVTGTYLTSDGFNLIGRGNLINQIEIGSQNASDYLTFIAGNAERARITAAGNFGIGLTNPSAPLHVKGSTYTNVIVDNNSATGGGSYLSYQNGTKKALFGLSGAFELNTGSDVAIASTIAGGGIKFYTNNSTTQAMGILSSGNAYLGQAPTFLGLGTEFIVRGQASDGVLGVMDSTEAVKGLFVSNSSLSWLGTYSNHPLAFRTNNTEWARISSGGNLLIGTIVDNATDKLQVNGTSYFADNIVLADSKGIISSGVNMLSRNNLNNQIIIGADGGINDNVAFYSGDLERMRLLANGRLAINKTTASYQVDVQGDVNVSGAFRVNGTIIPNGTVTSVAMSVPTGLVISGSPITSSGTLAVTYAVNYGIPTLTKQSDWDDAYTWVTNFPDQLGNSGKFLTTNGSVLSWASLVTGVSSVFGRTGAVTAQSGDYTTAQVTESGNLYYTDARARASLSFVAGSGAYNSTTGVITIPTNTNQLTNGASFITLASLSASAPLSYNNGTGAFSISQASGSTNGFLSSTDWNTFNNKQNALGYTPVPTTRTLTINGTSYDLSADRSWTIASGIGGSGTTNYLSKFTGSTSIGNSLIFDNGSGVGIGTTSPASYGLYRTLTIQGGSTANGGLIQLQNSDSTSQAYWFTTNNSSILKTITNHPLIFGANNTDYVYVTSGGNVGIGTSSPSSMLTINGTTPYIRLERAGVPTWEIRQNFPSTEYGFQVVNVTAGTIPFFVGNSGNVGIGTTSPNVGGWGRALTLQGVSNAAYEVTEGTVRAALFSAAASIAGLSVETNHPLGLYTNGTERMRITSAGNVGIGVTNPSDKLYVGGNVGATGYIYSNDGTRYLFLNPAADFGFGSNPSIQVSTNHNLQFATNNTQRMVITSGGNVGIGTTSPGQILTLSSASTSGTALNIINTSSGGYNWNIFSEGSDATKGPVGSLIFRDSSNGVTRMLVSPSGNVGIGTTNPAYKLDVSASSIIRGTLAIDNNGTDNTLTEYIRFERNSQGSSNYFNSIYSSTGSGANFMQFRLSNTSGTQGTVMTLNGYGQVGIGTSSPSTALHVIGAGTFSSSVTATSFSATDATGSAILTTNGGGEGVLSVNTANPLRFFTNGSERMRITSGGFVGIGTTSPTGELHIFGSQPAFRIQSSVSGNMQFGQWDTTNNRIQSSGRDFLLIGTDAYNTIFSTNSTEKMRITSGGNVGIGTTSPSTALHVIGAGTFSSSVTATSFSVSNGSLSNNGFWGTLITAGSGSGYDFGIVRSNTNAIAGVPTGTGNFYFANNVGIGTTSPSQKLTLSNTDADVLIDFVRNGTNRGTIGHKFVFGVQNELGITANYPTTIGFYTNGARRLYIDPFGKVGVNTTSFATSDYFKVEGQTSINGDLILHSSTQLGYGLSLPNASNTGEAVAKTWVVYSDARVKKNVSELNYGIDSINKLKPISYNHHNSEFQNGEINILEKYKYEIGFIAQEVYDVIPEVVNPGNDTQLWTMNYERLTSVIVKGMQEQQVMIETNAEKIARLEKRVLQLESKNA